MALKLTKLKEINGTQSNQSSPNCFNQRMGFSLGVIFRFGLILPQWAAQQHDAAE
jgi:hypothetical protein